MIYFDNAATTMKKPQDVIDAVVEAMNSMGNAGRGAHAATLKASRSVYDTRVKTADFFGVSDPSCIVFTSNSTESLNIAIKGVFNPGDHVITTHLEHNSVLRPLYEMESQNVEISFIKSDSYGRVNVEAIESAIKKNTRAIICTHGSNLTGNLLDIEYIGRIAHKNNLIFIVDASQTAGVIPIDVEKMNIDILCFTGHKSLLGPQGTGGLYVRPGIHIRPLKTGGSGVHTFSKTHPGQMPTALEAGTLNGHGLAGLSASIDWIRKTGIDVIHQKELTLMWQFYHGVKHIPGVKIYGEFDEHKNRCPIVTLNIGDYDSGLVSDELYTEYGIATRAGAHCAPLMHEDLGTVRQGAVRFSFGYFNTADEVNQAIQAIKELAEEE